MATITVNGIVSTPLSEYVTLWQQIYIDAYGSTVNLDQQSPQGQIIGLAALDFKQIDDVLIDTFNSSGINTATGVQIDNIAENLDIKRGKAKNTQVDVVLNGVAFTVINAGSQAKDNNNNVFNLDEEVTLDGVGVGSGVMTAQEGGAIIVEIGSLINIVSAVSGWETVNNLFEGITGEPIETNAAFKRRYSQSVKINGQSMRETIEAAILALENVNDATVKENFDSTTKIIDNVSVLPHTIAASVLGGDLDEIAQTLADTRGTGVGYTGTTLISLTNLTNNQVEDVLFFETNVIEIEIELTIKTGLTFPSDVITQIKNNLVDYFNGEFTVSTGDNIVFGVT